MNTLTTIEQKNLLERVEELNRGLENYYLRLGMEISIVHETEAWKSLGYETFADYYRQELRRDKSSISRLVGVGYWLRLNNVELPPDNVSYRALDKAIKQFPDKEPKEVLALASTWNDSDFRDEVRDTCEGHELGKERWAKCTKCGSFILIEK
jgi:hypothetical protein